MILKTKVFKIITTFTNMGIFNFWGWFKSNFSGAIYKLNGTQNLKSIDINMDNLLIDMNGLFHTSTQKINLYHLLYQIINYN